LCARSGRVRPDLAISSRSLNRDSDTPQDRHDISPFIVLLARSRTSRHRCRWRPAITRRAASGSRKCDVTPQHRSGRRRVKQLPWHTTDTIPGVPPRPAIRSTHDWLPRRSPRGASLTTSYPRDAYCARDGQSNRSLMAVLPLWDPTVAAAGLLAHEYCRPPALLFANTGGRECLKRHRLQASAPPRPSRTADRASAFSSCRCPKSTKPA